MRTQEEIVAKYNQNKKVDVFNMAGCDLIEYMDYEHARPYIREDITPEEFEEIVSRRKDPMQNIIEYMPFAWSKANSCKGLSSNRSIMHMINWLWLSGNDELSKKVEQAFESDYAFYGKNILAMICNELGIYWADLDDGQWRDDELDYPVGPPVDCTVERPLS